MNAPRHKLVFRLRLIVWAALCCLIATSAEALPFLPRCDVALHVRSASCVLQQDRASAVAVLAALRAIADGQATAGAVLQPSSLAPNPSLARNGISRGLSDVAAGAWLAHPRFVTSSDSRVMAIVDGADPAGLGAERPAVVLDELPVAALDPVTCLLFAVGLFGVGLSIAMYRRGIGADLDCSLASMDGFREVTRRACVCVTFGRLPMHLIPLRI
jgi:hypothetical protein